MILALCFAVLSWLLWESCHDTDIEKVIVMRNLSWHHHWATCLRLWNTAWKHEVEDCAFMPGSVLRGEHWNAWINPKRRTRECFPGGSCREVFAGHSHGKAEQCCSLPERSWACPAALAPAWRSWWRPARRGWWGSWGSLGAFPFSWTSCLCPVCCPSASEAPPGSPESCHRSGTAAANSQSQWLEGKEGKKETLGRGNKQKNILARQRPSLGPVKLEKVMWMSRELWGLSLDSVPHLLTPWLVKGRGHRK